MLLRQFFGVQKVSRTFLCKNLLYRRNLNSRKKPGERWHVTRISNPSLGTWKISGNRARFRIVCDAPGIPKTLGLGTVRIRESIAWLWSGRDAVCETSRKPCYNVTSGRAGAIYRAAIGHDARTLRRAYAPGKSQRGGAGKNGEKRKYWRRAQEAWARGNGPPRERYVTLQRALARSAARTPPSWPESRYVEVRECLLVKRAAPWRRRRRRHEGDLRWCWPDARAEIMFFPVGWPRVLNTCERGKISAVVCNRDKIMFAVLTADALVIWYCKARNSGRERICLATRDSHSAADFVNSFTFVKTRNAIIEL